VGVIARVRALAVGIAKAYLEQQSSDDAKSAEEVPAAGDARSKKARKAARPKETAPVA
jgi:hypothetical protein